jgi:hypothetical protein
VALTNAAYSSGTCIGGLAGCWGRIGRCAPGAKKGSHICSAEYRDSNGYTYRFDNCPCVCDAEGLWVADPEKFAECDNIEVADPSGTIILRKLAF